MLNEWSDREPDPPRCSAFAIVLAAIVGAATLAFAAQIALLIWGD